MFNEYNIKIFDYIFSVNNDEYVGGQIDTQNEINKLEGIMEENHITQYDFWNEYKFIVSNNDIFDASNLNENVYGYNRFPKIKLSYIDKYLDYKFLAFSRILEENINYKFEINNLKVDLNVTNEYSVKKIIDKCISNRLILSNGSYWIEIPNTKYGRIMGDNLEVNSEFYKKSDDTNKSGSINNYFNGNFYGDISQINNFNNDDEFFYMVLNKLDAMQLESNLSAERIEAIRSACESKNKNKVVEFLKEIVIGTGTNLIANGILMKLGLM